MALPLPGRIPIPEDDDLLRLIDMGIEIDLCGDKYVEYTLPPKWKMVDASETDVSPLFCIVDDKNLERVTILGSWKGYSNYLKMCVWKDPGPFKHVIAAQKQPGETMEQVIVNGLALLRTQATTDKHV